MASAEEAAQIQLKYISADESREEVVVKTHTHYISQAARIPTGATFEALPRITPTKSMFVRQGGVIRWEAKSDAADTVESEESNILVEIDLHDVNTGRYLRTLQATTEEFTGFQSSNTDDVVLVTTGFTKLGDYTVPSGLKARVRALRHVYLGDDTA